MLSPSAKYSIDQYNRQIIWLTRAGPVCFRIFGALPGACRPALGWDLERKQLGYACWTAPNTRCSE